MAIVYDLYLSFWSIKLVLTLIKMRKDISKATSMLIPTNRSIFSKNQNFSSLSSTKKETITILKDLNLLLSIFCVSMLVFQIWKSSFFAKLGYIVLNLLSKLMELLIKYWLNWAEYWIYKTYSSLTVGLSRMILGFYSIPATITNVEIAKTNTCFLALCWNIC